MKLSKQEQEFFKYFSNAEIKEIYIDRSNRLMLTDEQIEKRYNIKKEVS